MLYFGKGSPGEQLPSDELRQALFSALEGLGPRRKVLLVPPDFTRFHSRAGELTRFAWEYYGHRVTDILPALGTHAPMTDGELERMFGSVPRHLFRVHDWRAGLTTLGTVPASFVKEVSGGAVDYDWPAQVSTLLAEGGHDLVLSFGQVVPHEVIGMAGYNKNLFVGAGGLEGIGKSHFLGAAYGMERIMGRADTPVRRVLNYAAERFGKSIPVVYVQTVVGPAPGAGLAVRGLYIGDDSECFSRASALSLRVNFSMLDQPLRTVVVYLNDAEFRSTWLGNKAIYRTRMALADGAHLIVLAPGVRQFGEDAGIDELIRRYGYAGTARILELVGKQKDLAANLSAAAHLIHGSSEGRFAITYCPGGLSRKEVESVGFRYAPLEPMLKKYDIAKLRDGVNTTADGEEIYYISNPAIGLWAHKDRFGDG